jgi:hypothetical protein
MLETKNAPSSTGRRIFFDKQGSSFVLKMKKPGQCPGFPNYERSID